MGIALIQETCSGIVRIFTVLNYLIKMFVSPLIQVSLMFSDTSFYTFLYESIYIFGFILVTMFFKIIFIIIIFVLVLPES